MSLWGYFLIALIVLAAGLAIFVTAGMRPTGGRKIGRYEQPRQALLVVDIQEDYTGLTAPVASPFKNTAAFIATVNQVIGTAADKNMLIAYIGHEWPDNFFCRLISRGLALAGQPGARQDDRLAIASPHYFSKRRSDAFSSPALEQFLIENQVDEVFVVGLDAVYCAFTTALGALNRNYKATIITDAVITSRKITPQELVAMYRRKGISTVDSAGFTA